MSFDTLIPLWNGQIKRADELILEDKLIGDDGKIRNITNIINGKGQMYEITQTSGESYKVNGQHILTLHMPDHKVIFWNATINGWAVLWWNNETNNINCKNMRVSIKKIKCPECNIELHSHLKRHYKRHYKRQQPELKIPLEKRKSPTIVPDTDEVRKARKEIEEFCKTIPDCNVFDMSIQDYMKLNDTIKMRLAGIRCDCVQWEKKYVSLDPYVLGLWLGAGDSNGYGYACYGDKDHEIIDYLQTWCKENGITMIQKDKNHYRFNNDNSKSPIRYFLNKYNLRNNKHIPIDYIVNDRDTRLKVLAGIIDTDGHVQRNGTRVSIAQGLNHERLANDIVFLVRSLGFHCSFTTKKTSRKSKGILKKGTCYNINISGNLEDIPTKLPRKKCANIKIQSNKTTGQIKIKDIGIDNYIGIEIDSNQRFVINDFTVTHNCTNIFSKEFNVDIVNSKDKKKYVQQFSNNMYDREDPVITSVDKKAKSYVQITFTPDYERFGVESLSDDMVSLFKKRVYDLAAVTNVKVYLNDELIDIPDFEDYIKLYYPNGELPSNLIYEKVHERWKVGVLFDSNPGFRQISYVNGICTFQGGAHVTHVVDQIVGALHDKIMAKNKGLKIKSASIRDNLTFFVDAVIEDPGFSSQTKEFLTTKVANFGSKCIINDKFIQQLSKTGIIEEVVNFAKFRAMADLKKLDGKKKSSLKGLIKLTDAHWAGTRKSKDCCLILTEGDSAKSYALSGLEILGKDRYGVFPLRGKLLNVREATPEKLKQNEEIKNIIQIMGLKHAKKYLDVSQLRYGRILVLTDQDYDGSHIKGLIINFIHFFWPSLLKINGFITSFRTAIIKVWLKTDTKKKNVNIFYTLTDYQEWKDNVDNIKKYSIKYYKGLGTSTESEAKESFNDFEQKMIKYIWDQNEPENNDNIILEDYDDNQNNENDDTEVKSIASKSETDDDYDDFDKTNECYDAITLAFAKNRANDRKRWLEKYNKNIILETTDINVTYKEFIDKDLIHFSNYDNIRSIPSMCDGFKPSIRKILYGSILKKIFKESIKVSQLAGYISDVSGYHHGEASLQGAIVGMAQNFVGSNNINWLVPDGNFGYRKMGGKDAASARYIFTQLIELVPFTFRHEDECIYTYMDDDGTPVEPETYAPIVCNIAINGASGIGTGFSTKVLSHNPLDVIKNQKLILKGKKQEPMTPWFKGFRGDIVKLNNNTFETHGLYEIINENTIIIYELPVETWTENYREFLETLVADDIKNPKKGQIIKRLVDDSGNNNVKFTIELFDDILQDLIKKNELMKKFKLINKHSTTNMHLYDSNGMLKKYNTMEEILEEYCQFRLKMYGKRKEYYLKILEDQLNLLGWKIRFIDYVIAGKIIVYEKDKPRTKDNVIKQIADQKFPELSPNPRPYDYLTGLGLFSLTEEERDKLKDEYAKKLEEFNIYKNTTIHEIWLSELNEFEKRYIKWYDEQIDEQTAKTTKKTKMIKKRRN